jgi:hypothetical protein
LPSGNTLGGLEQGRYSRIPPQVVEMKSWTREQLIKYFFILFVTSYPLMELSRLVMGSIAFRIGTGSSIDLWAEVGELVFIIFGWLAGMLMVGQELLRKD